MSQLTPSADSPTLFLIDGYALIYRAFYAMISRPLTTSSGENTSAPYGLARFLMRLLEDHEPDDPWRVTLAPKAWWAGAFRQAGFERTRSPYLWRSTREVWRAGNAAQPSGV